MTDLREYTKDEFRDICRHVAKSFGKPFDNEQFERDWAEFMEMKRRKTLN